MAGHIISAPITKKFIDFRFSPPAFQVPEKEKNDIFVSISQGGYKFNDFR